MQERSNIYKKLLADQLAVIEIKVTIAGEEYGQDRLVSVQTNGGLFPEEAFGIGGTRSREIELIVREPGTIPRMAEIRLYARLTNGETASEWLPKGVFYIDTRATDPFGTNVTIHGYDAMLKTEQTYTGEGAQGQWPKTDIAAVNEIAQIIGVEVDSRTTEVMTQGFQVQYPGYGDSAYTMREVLKYIAVMYAGNWVMSDEGKLYLVAIAKLPKETSYLLDDVGDTLLLGGDTRILL